MARGWESKSVEAQIEEGERAGEDTREHRSKAVRRREQALESLRLSRSRIEQQLEKAVYPAHREMLMKALQALEKETEDIRSASLNGEA
jgi:hypothetical protein